MNVIRLYSATGRMTGLMENWKGFVTRGCKPFEALSQYLGMAGVLTESRWRLSHTKLLGSFTSDLPNIWI
jgi:hypothetical protein